MYYQSWKVTRYTCCYRYSYFFYSGLIIALLFFRNCNSNIIFFSNDNEFNSYFYHYFLYFEPICDIISVYSIFSLQLVFIVHYYT